MSRDPRILWVSDDGQWAVIMTENLGLVVPTWRSSGMGSLEKATRVLTEECPTSPGTSHRIRVGRREDWWWFVQNDAAKGYYIKVPTASFRGVDLGLTPVPLNYGASGPPVQRKAMKDWPHDCPKCKGRECAIQLAVTWDCRNGCFK